MSAVEASEPSGEPEPHTDSEPEPEPEPGPQPEPEHVDPVKRNSHGGVLVTESEIDAAFKFLDVAKKGPVDYEEIKARLAVFQDDCGLPKDVKALMEGAEFTQKNVMKLLKNNKVADFDPVAEAFSMFDPNGEGHVDMKVVRDIFRKMGMGELTSDEIKLIRETGGNPSGYITLEDFRNMIAKT